MNSSCKNESSGRATTFFSKAPVDTPAPPPSQPAKETPVELELGGVAVVIDHEGVIIAAEDICRPLFKWEPTELIGHPLEILLLAGTDKIRQYLVPDQASAGSEGGAVPRLFALAQRKDGVSFPVAVTLELTPPEAGCWWAVAFHDVNASPAVQRETTTTGLPPAAATVRRGRAQVAGPAVPEIVPDIFKRAPAEAASAPTPPASTTPAASEPGPTPRLQLSPEPTAPAATASEPPPAQPESRSPDLGQQLRQATADLKRTRAHLQQQDNLIHNANAAAQQAAAALQAEAARRGELELELAQANQFREELLNQLATEQQARAEAEARLQEVEQRLAETVEELKRVQAQPPLPAPAPAPAEADPALQEQLLDLEGRLRTAVTSLARATAELESERGERRRCEQRAASLSTRMQQLHEDLKNHLESEQLDRQRLAQVEHQLHEQVQQNDLTIAKLRSGLQIEECERKRLEAELLRSRVLPTDSARVGRAQVNGLRRQLQPPVESLHQSSCRLLQLGLSDEQKQLVQTMLENTLLLQTSLQESREP